MKPFFYEHDIQYILKFDIKTKIAAKFKEFVSIPTEAPDKQPIEKYIDMKLPLFEVRLPRKIPGGPPFTKELNYWIDITQKLKMIEKAVTPSKKLRMA
jgi:hypothetical protein